MLLALSGRGSRVAAQRHTARSGGPWAGRCGAPRSVQRRVWRRRTLPKDVRADARDPLGSPGPAAPGPGTCCPRADGRGTAPVGPAGPRAVCDAWPRGAGRPPAALPARSLPRRRSPSSGLSGVPAACDHACARATEELSLSFPSFQLTYI